MAKLKFVDPIIELCYFTDQLNKLKIMLEPEDVENNY